MLLTLSAKPSASYLSIGDLSMSTSARESPSSLVFSLNQLETRTRLSLTSWGSSPSGVKERSGEVQRARSQLGSPRLDLLEHAGESRGQADRARVSCVAVAKRSLGSRHVPRPVSQIEGQERVEDV